MTKLLYEINSKEELEEIVCKAVEDAFAKSNIRKEKKKDEILTTKELCAWLKLSRVTIWQLTKKGILPFIRVGNQKRYSKSAVLNKLTEINQNNI